MRYAIARYRSQRRDLAYRIYVSDALRIITENTAKFAGGSFVKARYAELIKPQHKDDRSAEDIAAEIIIKAGIKVI